jgi:hypothetical protein
VQWNSATVRMITFILIIICEIIQFVL